MSAGGLSNHEADKGSALHTTQKFDSLEELVQVESPKARTPDCKLLSIRYPSYTGR